MHANAHLTRRRHVRQQVTKCHCMCQYPQGSCCLLSGMTAGVREPNCHTSSRDATKTRQDSGTSWHTSTETPNDVCRRAYLTGVVVDLHMRPEGRGVAGEHRQVLHSDAERQKHCATKRHGKSQEMQKPHDTPCHLNLHGLRHTVREECRLGAAS